MAPVSYPKRKGEKSLSGPWDLLFNIPPGFFIQWLLSLTGDGEQRWGTEMLIHPPLLETKSFTSESVVKGRAPAAVLRLKEERCFPVSSVRSLSDFIGETWKLL